jgi:predicted amidophosphoribosyltransferase
MSVLCLRAAIMKRRLMELTQEHCNELPTCSICGNEAKLNAERICSTCAEAQKEHEGAVCSECGRTVTEGEYSLGESLCHVANVIAVEDFGKGGEL